MFMKTLCVMVLALLLTADTSFAREYKARKKTADYTVEMSIDRNPPIVDKNTLSLEIPMANMLPMPGFS
jgi:hypothetical protein